MSTAAIMLLVFIVLLGALAVMAKDQLMAMMELWNWGKFRIMWSNFQVE